MKWLSVILLSAALALFCPACGDDDNAGEGPQTQSPADVDSPTGAERMIVGQRPATYARLAAYT